jgi:hypothetical protein
VSISGSGLGSFKKTACWKSSSIICLAFLWAGRDDGIPSSMEERDRINALVCRRLESGEAPRGEMDRESSCGSIVDGGDRGSIEQSAVKLVVVMGLLM